LPPPESLRALAQSVLPLPALAIKRRALLGEDAAITHSGARRYSYGRSIVVATPTTH
jgi:hypothetical protein